MTTNPEAGMRLADPRMTAAEASPLNAIRYAVESWQEYGDPADAMTFLDMWEQGDLSESEQYREWCLAAAPVPPAGGEGEPDEVEYQVWQDDMMVAASDTRREAEHYAAIYGQDGPVELKHRVSWEFAGFGALAATAAETGAVGTQGCEAARSEQKPITARDGGEARFAACYENGAHPDCHRCYRGEVPNMSDDSGLWVEMGAVAGGANEHGLRGWIELIEHHPDGRTVRREYIATDSLALAAGGEK